MKIPKNFIDPENTLQKKNYATPIWSRTALLQLINISGKKVSYFSALSLYKKDRKKKEALSFRLKAMIRDGQLIAIEDTLYLPECFPRRQGTVIRKHHRLFAVFPESKQALAIEFGEQELFEGDSAQFHVIEETSQAYLEKVIKKQPVFLHGYAESTDDYDAPTHAGGILLVKSGPLEGQAVCLYPDPKLKKAIKHQSLIIAELDRNSTEECLFATAHTEHEIPTYELIEAITRYNIRYDLSCEVMKEAESFVQTVRKNQTHTDLTDLNFVTIDGETAKDFDDAVFAKKVPQGYDLYVAIADVASYVKPQSAIDLEAAKRGVSVYFPGYVVPMLPEILSNNLCSLRPHRIRKTLTCLIRLRNNAVESFSFFPAMIRSKARLTYAQVSVGEEPKELKNDIQSLWDVFDILAANRKRKGYLAFESSETKFIFNKKGELKKIQQEKPLKAHKLIEEMMLCANICAAQFLDHHYGQKGVFRVHPEPSEEKVTSLNDSLYPYGLELSPPFNIERINEFCQKLYKKLPQLSSLSARLMQRANYQIDPEPHFGLNEELYSHFTSPIRRYPDLLVHRLIYQALSGTKAQSLSFEQIAKDLGEVNILERKAEEAERFYHQILKVQFALKLKPQKLKGTIVALTSFGFFVQCDDFPLEGLVHFSDINQGYCQLQAGIITCDFGKNFLLGQSCSVRIKDIDTINYRLNFSLEN